MLMTPSAPVRAGHLPFADSAKGRKYDQDVTSLEDGRKAVDNASLSSPVMGNGTLIRGLIPA
jgi:hypothetical protein